jgi:hypothetical protein
LSLEVDRGAATAAVARRHGVRPATLTWWRWKLRSESRRGPRLLPIVVDGELQAGPAPAVGGQLFEVVLGSVSVRVVGGADVQYAAALVVALRNAGC